MALLIPRLSEMSLHFRKTSSRPQNQTTVIKDKPEDVLEIESDSQRAHGKTGPVLYMHACMCMELKFGLWSTMRKGLFKSFRTKEIIDELQI